MNHRAIVAIAIVGGFFLSSCQSPVGSNSNSNQTSIAYSVEFDIESVHHSLTAGPTGTSNGIAATGIPYAQYSVSNGKTYYGATKTAYSATISSESFTFYFTSNNPTGSFAIDNVSSMNLDYSPDGTAKYYCEPAHQISLTITKNESAGGVIEGTFSGTVSDQATATPTILPFTNGKFTLYHYANAP